METRSRVSYLAFLIRNLYSRRVLLFFLPSPSFQSDFVEFIMYNSSAIIVLIFRDPCCTIPVCDSPAHSSSEPAKSNNDRPDNPIERVHFPTKPSSRPGSSSSAVLDPASEPFCIANGQLFAVGHAWQEGSGCLRRSCECVQLNNGSTAADCKGGCAPIPPTALVPTLECPKPQMVTPEDACLCPYVVCNHNRSRKSCAHTNLLFADEADARYRVA